MIKQSRRLVAALVAIAGVIAAPATQGWQAPPRTAPNATGQGQGDTFLCGTDAALPNPIPLRWSTVVLAGDGRLFMPCPAGDHPQEHREAREQTLIDRAIGSRSVELRRTGVQALSRTRPAVGTVSAASTVETACSAQAVLLGSPATPLRWHPGQLFHLLADADGGVRREAAYGIGLQLSRAGLDPEVAIGARTEIAACLQRPQEGVRVFPMLAMVQRDPGVRGLLLEAAGVTRYGDNAQRDLAEALLVRHATGPDEQLLGAVKGLEALIRQDPRRPVQDATRVRLRDLVFHGARATAPPPGDLAARIRRVAMMALVAARDDDPLTLQRASVDADWQVRRLVASGLTPARLEQAAIAAALAVDSELQVRYEVVGALARDVTRTRRCAPLLMHLADREPLVAMRAMDGLVASCTDLPDAVAALIPLAHQITQTASHVEWHKPSRALTALARIAPAEAASRMPSAVTHPAWQVRAAAAAASAVMGSPEWALAVWRDPVPNVRTAALEALARLKTPITLPTVPAAAQVVPEGAPAVVAAAIDALATGTDYQLLRTAATVLRGAPAEHRAAATDALLGALRRLTDAGDDTSRDPRVAILDRLGELMPPARSADLLPYTADFDDEVVAAAGKAFAALVGAPPAPAVRQRRYPYQPIENTLQSLPRTMEIVLDKGTVVVELLPSIAPVTIARLAALGKAGHYTGLTFHRIVPNFVVQGGSPGANEYVGVSRYMRDEPGASHLRGAVGISTRGRDTGDAQLFIDLVDVPRLDRDYTVFGYVRSGMQFVDRLLEGATIKSVSFK